MGLPLFTTAHPYRIQSWRSRGRIKLECSPPHGKEMWNFTLMSWRDYAPFKEFWLSYEAPTMTSASCGGLATSTRWCIPDPSLLTQGDAPEAGVGSGQSSPFSFHLTSDRIVASSLTITHPRYTGRPEPNQPN